MSDRMTNERGHDDGDKVESDERPVTHEQDETKTGMHRPGEDPRKQIPATEGGEA